MTGRRAVHRIRAGIMVSVLFVVPVRTLTGQEVHPRAGETSVPLLNFGFGPVGTGLAEGLTAWSGSPDAVWWNPAAAALYATGEGSILSLNGARLPGETSNTSISYGRGIRRAGVVFLASFSGTSGIEVRDDLPTPDPLSTTSAYDLSAGVSVGFPLAGVGIGLTVKGIYEKLHYADAFGAACDAGVQIPLPGGFLMAGAAVRNLGRMGVLDTRRLVLSSSKAIGLALARPVLLGTWSINAGADIWKPEDDWTQLRVGVEASHDPLRLRLGTRQGKGWRTLSAGLGLALDGWRFDYSYVYDPDPDRRFTGNIQRLGIQIFLDERKGIDR
ncbi:hypothetical protein ACFL6T_01705 [Candidatus Zixiibacteriota bacterium]